MKRLLMLALVLVLIASACSAGASPATQVPPTQEQAAVTLAEPTVVPPTATTEPTATLEPSPTPVPPTDTPVPPTETPTRIPPTHTPTPEPTVDLQAAVKSAKIILFEDMWFERYIKPALDYAGYEYTDVADKVGTLKEELLSDKKWDLLIAAAEGRGGVEGEFFDYIQQQLDSGASVILEMWTLDWIADGRIKPILKQCGIEFQKNWVNPSNRGVFWSDPNLPIANFPNQVMLNRFTNYWSGDVGDLVRKTKGSTATILASADQANSEENGLLTLCYDGRLLIQTFSTHDHARAAMAQTWQNYVLFMLANRYK